MDCRRALAVELILVCPIIIRMRRLFLFLMIVLLPLRGWVGDAMAMEMAAQTINATPLVANYVYPTRASGLFDSKNSALTDAECPGHAPIASGVAPDLSDAVSPADVAHTDTPANDATRGHCNTCGVCQICHTVALAQAVAMYRPDFTPHALPSIGSVRFSSAFAALSQKPPIS